jgi:hypothetical protein
MRIEINRGITALHLCASTNSNDNARTLKQAGFGNNRHFPLRFFSSNHQIDIRYWAIGQRCISYRITAKPNYLHWLALQFLAVYRQQHASAFNHSEESIYALDA